MVHPMIKTITHIRLMSDLHLEFAPLRLSKTKYDVSSVLVLAGDIGLVHSECHLNDILIPFLVEQSHTFHSVIYVLGNHEHYHGSINATARVLADALTTAQLHNVHLLDNSTISISGINFIGSTLWTDGSSDVSSQFIRMSDSEVIKSDNGIPVEASDLTALHHLATSFIEQELITHANEKNVVITHHLPLLESLINPIEGLDVFYATDLSNLIARTGPNLWIHGHSHTSVDYIKTLDIIDSVSSHISVRVISNPRGDRLDANVFNDCVIIDVNQI